MKSFLQRVAAGIRTAFLELGRDWRQVGHYLSQPEAHVFSFSIAANVLLAFYPLMVMLLAICRDVFHSNALEQSIYVGLQDYFAQKTGRFLNSNLFVSLASTRRLEWTSLILLLITANGVFLPLEVALNKAWGVAKNRNILMNQLVSTGLIVLGGALMMVSTSVTGLLVSVTRAGPVVWWDADNRVARTAAASPWLQAMFKLPSIPITILILFLVYWLLPNTKVPWRLILPRAAVIGLILECLKWINLVIWPWVFDKFKAEYGPFVNTVTIITWSYIAGLIVLAGGDWSARRARAAEAAAAEAVLDPTVAAPVETSPNPGGGGRIG